MSDNIKPTHPKNRIHSLDLLRGFAILGILIMNIISFSNIGTGYINPTVGAGIEGYNGVLHAFGYVFADMRFMSIFSILFGAGVLLFTDNLKKKKLSLTRYHYKRMVLLLIFGLIHAYLIWMGDILVAYAICGSFVFLMRNKKTKTLLLVGSVFFCIPIVLSLSNYFFAPQEILVETYSFFTPTQEKTNNEIAAYTGSYLDQMEPRMEGAIELQTLLFLLEQFWRVMSMMLLGMILYRKGVLSAERDNSYYKNLIWIGLSVGLIISIMGLYRSYDKDWYGVWVMSVGHQYNYIASVFVALAYIGLIMLWSKSNIFTLFKARLQAAGRLAFTNYIGTSLICTFIFYGHGLGLFATMDRLQQWGVILFIWALILIISPLILKRYRQGPLEWLWRKLTYL